MKRVYNILNNFSILIMSICSLIDILIIADGLYKNNSVQIIIGFVQFFSFLCLIIEEYKYNDIMEEVDK